MDTVQRDGTLDSQHTPLTGLGDEFGVGGGGSGSGSGPPLQALSVTCAVANRRTIRGRQRAPRFRLLSNH
jgi:hypothetical protein